MVRRIRAMCTFSFSSCESTGLKHIPMRVGAAGLCVVAFVRAEEDLLGWVSLNMAVASRKWDWVREVKL